jgi:hypothetical protein
MDLERLQNTDGVGVARSKSHRLLKLATAPKRTTVGCVLEYPSISRVLGVWRAIRLVIHNTMMAMAVKANQERADSAQSRAYALGSGTCGAEMSDRRCTRHVRALDGGEAESGEQRAESVAAADEARRRRNKQRCARFRTDATAPIAKPRSTALVFCEQASSSVHLGLRSADIPGLESGQG